MTRSNALTVLFVDDEPAELELLADYFDADPVVSPATAASAETALEQVRRTDVDCLVSDGLLTGDGQPFLEAARRAVPELSTVLYSASAPDVSPDALDASIEKTASTGATTTLAALRAVIGLVTRPDDGPPEGDTGERHWRVLGYYDWRQTSEVATTILLALAAERGVDVLELDPLHGAVDPQALNRLFDTGAAAPPADPVQVEFRYEDARIHVGGDGLVAYR